ncbi:MAG TPA: response regulator [Candidatus Acidoferrum sp.]|nr:response regulator [Candidatus Acidoferrum sp.]
MTQDMHDILLVEDDPADAELTTMALQKQHAAGNIVIARDGAEALDYLFCRGEFLERDFQHIPRVVLLDLKLPRVSGHDVLKAIKGDERTRCIPVIVMTSSNHENDLLECYRGGANSYIQKPMSLSLFQESVKQVGSYWLGVNLPPPEAAFQTR